jgi:pimeloyl-ACP methyl ester carboxylesterase
MVTKEKLASIVLSAAVLLWGGVTAKAQQGPTAEQMSVTTSDGVVLHGMYFPGAARKGSTQAKQTTPVVMLHDFKGTRATFAPLSQALLAPGDPNVEHPYFAVVVVDLRGHGESTKQLTGDGGVTDLDPAKLGKEGLEAMAKLDMEAIRDYLVDKNDAGELNLNKLCLVGSGMGASVAVNWAAHDWSAPPLAVGKQGQDVKGLVLISPRWSYNGLMMQEALKFGAFKKNVAWMLIGGAQDQKAKQDLSRVQAQLEKLHPPTDKNGAKQRSGLEVLALPTSLEGDVLLGKSGDAIDPAIVKFLTEYVGAAQLPWTNRRNRIP